METDETPKPKGLKQLDFTQSSFEAMGVKYFINSSLSIERYRWFEKYQLEFGFGISFKDLHDTFAKSVAMANKGRGIEAWNAIFNIWERLDKDLEKSINPALLLCALFIVTEDEDSTKWDVNQANEKIANWNSEGYDVNSFFQLAANLVTGYITALEGHFQNISELAAIMDEAKKLNDLKPND